MMERLYQISVFWFEEPNQEIGWTGFSKLHFFLEIVTYCATTSSYSIKNDTVLAKSSFSLILSKVTSASSLGVRFDIFLAKILAPDLIKNFTTLRCPLRAASCNGESLPNPFKFKSAPNLCKTLTTEKLPLRKNWGFLFVEKINNLIFSPNQNIIWQKECLHLTEKSFFFNYFYLPRLQASCKGDHSALSWTLGSAPICNNWWTKRVLPRMAAVCNGVSPLVFFLEIFFKSRSTVGEWPFWCWEKMVRRNEVVDGVVPFDEGLSAAEDDDEVAAVPPPALPWPPTFAPLASVTTWSGALGGDINTEGSVKKWQENNIFVCITIYLLSSFYLIGYTKR